MARQIINPSQQKSELGYAEVTSGQGSITTLTDLTGLSTTVTVPNGATILVEGWIPQVYSTVDNDRIDLYIREGSTSLAIAYNLATVSSKGWGGAYVRVRLQPTSGSHTYKLSLTRGVGTGTLSTYADAATKAHIQVRVV